MPTKDCNNSKKIAQTLFLGASVANYNVSLGWGAQPSQLTVNLIEDKVSPFCDPYGQPIAKQFADYKGDIPPNHYHDCEDDDCYMLADGTMFNSDIHDISARQTLGKVYYQMHTAPPVVPKGGKSNCALSEYWFNPDPGFIGIQNRLNYNGDYINIYNADNTNLNPGYDIINCPVFFKVGDFSFGGIVQSWNRSQSNSGDIITVNIEDMRSVLSNCYIILDKFSGAIYSKLKNNPNDFYGGPKNWLGTSLDYTGRLYNGNIPNVFNVYGFLESFTLNSFGGSNKNKNGISVNDIVEAITILTSNIAGQENFYMPLNTGSAPKSAFSPFGRILTKTIQTTDTFLNILPDFNTFGVIPPSISLADGIPRNEFVLDLSELPKLPNDFRINDPIISIIDLISRITEESGYDFTFDLNPISYNNEILNIIKLKLVSRNSQPRPNQIQNTVNQLLCDGFSVSSVTYGQEKNNTNLKSVVIGANQQRLLQLKSTRLSYTQANLIFNSETLEFVNYDTLGNSLLQTKRFHHGKYRYPSPFSTNNPDLSKQINPNQTDLYDHNETISNIVGGNDFSSIDSEYSDDGLLGSVTNQSTCGNYFKTEILTQSDPLESNDPSNVGGYNQIGTIMGQSYRFFPLFKDAICPFFGYVRDEEVKIDTTEDTNTDFRKIRPVYLDTWTGQICVLLQVHEFPQLEVDLIPTITSNGTGYILISESEIRAALAGFDNFLVYSLAKIFRPDLMESLRLAHRKRYYDKLIREGFLPSEASDRADKKYDWFWRQVYGNIAGPFGQPVEVAPAKNDGASYIDDNAMQDYQILHQFINQLGSYYGKQYMVSLPNLQSYKDQQYADITLSTSFGDCYIFKGDGDLYYNYQPTDGAWEEPGNIIDDAIVVGGSNYYALAEKDGKMGCLLGYNANKYFDYTKSEMCKFAQQVYAQNRTDMDDQKLNPAWSYQIFDELLNMREQSCPINGFVFDNINIASLPITDYVTVPISGSIAKDAWGYNIADEPMRKLYVKAQMDPTVRYIYPDSLFFPKAIITSPGLSLNHSSSQYKKDPNRTVIANVSIEDLNLYLKTTKKEAWDYEFIAYMLYYVSPSFKGLFQGNYAVNSDESANHVEIAPKAANPFFAAIPIRHNNYVYGPWANNVYVDYLRDPESVFPSGQTIKLSDTLPYTCSTSDISINDINAKNIIDNLIGPISVEIDEELAPWNFGGSAFMDEVANLKAYSKVNYQAIIESAQIQMPGLPIFDLGSDFSVSSFNNKKIDFGTYITKKVYPYTDEKYRDLSGLGLENYKNISLPNFIMPPVGGLVNVSETSKVDMEFHVVNLQTPIAKPATTITNVQVNIGSEGINTSYSLRTYTKKLTLFNKTDVDRVSKQGRQFVQRDKQLGSIRQQYQNIEIQQFKDREDKRMSEANAYFDSIGFSSKLFGWSPTTILIGQASPFLQRLEANPDYIPPDSLYVKPSGYGDLDGASNLSLPTGDDIGDDEKTKGRLLVSNENSHVATMINTLKMKTDVGLYELKEVQAQLSNDYGMQSAMSLDGLLSPISFYPTHKNSTYNYTKYDTPTCPFCKGTKLIKTEYKLYNIDNGKKFTANIFCDKCDYADKRLKFTLKNNQGSSSGEVLPPYIVTNLNNLDILKQFKNLGTGGSSSGSSSGGGASINLISLNPILVSNGQLRNPNTQNYSGAHPEGKHDALNIGAYAGLERPFFDRCYHSIEIVARGAVYQRHLTINDFEYDYSRGHNPNFYNEDLILEDQLKKRDTGAIPVLETYQMNQRFLGLRGPVNMHSWGYDTEGYPVPNAADEPYEIDSLGRPKRFKLKEVSSQKVKYGTADAGSVYLYNGNYYIKGTERLPLNPNIEIEVKKYENDLKNAGGFPGSENGTDRTSGYQGDIISKTQKWSGTSWSPKIKLNQFYLNFGERPDLWPVGPMELRWDEKRKVWCAPSSNIYKMVYVTLEEDLIKPADHYDETFAARAYLDELEYNKEPLPDGSRRLVYVKDKSGWTAPRGAKLLCRYDSDSGFYEPVSKPSYSVFGTIINNNEASISMHYVQGKSAGSVPSMRVSFDNKLNLTYNNNSKGFFNYDGGKWTLISVG